MTDYVDWLQLLQAWYPSILDSDLLCSLYSES